MSMIAIWGPPRSGKTTVTVDLAFAFSQNDKSVCLISPEPYSEISSRLNLNIPVEKSLSSAHKATDSLKQIVYKVDDLLYVLTVPSYNDAFAEHIGSDEAKAMLKQAKALFDIVLVDCPSSAGGGYIAPWALNMADRVLILSGAQASSYLWFHAFHKGLATVETRALTVCSQIHPNFDYCGLHKILEMEPEAWLPHIRGAEAALNIKPTLYRSSNKAYSTGINTICQKILGGEQ